jgi:arabinogalactan oligomer/maltooligosaccharide transport system permease protein
VIRTRRALRALVLAWALVCCIIQTAWADEITLWHSYRGAEQETLEGLLKEWNAQHPELTVTAEPFAPGVYTSKLTNDIPQGNGPDLFIAAHERVGDWSQTKLLREWTEQDASWASYHPTTVEALVYDGKRWGIPLSYKSVALFYNTEMVQVPPDTTDALIAEAKKHTASKEKRYGLVYESTNMYMHAGWLFGFGGQIFDAQGNFVLESAESADSFAFARALVNEHGVVPEEADGTLVSHLFNSRQAAFAINGPWFLGELDKDLPYAIAPLPIVSSTGQPAKPFLTVEAAFISARTENPDGARQVALFLADRQASITRAIKGRQPVANLSAYQDRRLSEDRVLMTFRRQLDASVPMPNRPEMSSVWEPTNRALRRVMRGAVEPDAALTEAKALFEVFQRPPPKERSLAPLITGLALLLLIALAIGARRFMRENMWPQVKANLPAYVYLAPAILGMMILIVIPFVVGSIVSLFVHTQGSFTFVGIENFYRIITSQDYGVTDPLSFYFTLLVTVMWTAINVFLHVSIGMGLALLLREPWLKMRGIYRVLLIVPWAVPNYITALIWKGMFHKQFGAINGVLDALGLEPVSWFSKFSTAFAANVTTNTWLGFPFMMVVILGALQAIPRDLEEAAEVDGASWWQRMRYVTLPLLRPSLVPAVVLGTVWTFNMFNIIYLVSGGEPDGATEILISESYKWAFERQNQYGYAAAYSVLIFLVLLAYSASTGQLKTRD